jgi:hypothetical protein
MSQRQPVRILRRITAFVLVAALATGATAHSIAAEANPREERSDAASSSDTKTQSHHGWFGSWASNHERDDASPPFSRSWLASIYFKLITLKSAVQVILAYAWSAGHTKPDNTCN